MTAALAERVRRSWKNHRGIVGYLVFVLVIGGMVNTWVQAERDDRDRDRRALITAKLEQDREDYRGCIERRDLFDVLGRVIRTAYAPMEFSPELVALFPDLATLNTPEARARAQERSDRQIASLLEQVGDKPECKKPEGVPE